MDEKDRKTYLEKLMNIALEDGIIDESEERMIQNFLNNYDQYSKILESALEDGIISLEEKAKLYSFRAKIYQENLHLANEDKQITEKEKNILIELNRLLHNIRVKESEFPSYDNSESE